MTSCSRAVVTFGRAGDLVFDWWLFHEFQWRFVILCDLGVGFGGFKVRFWWFAIGFGWFYSKVYFL